MQLSYRPDDTDGALGRMLRHLEGFTLAFTEGKH